MKPNTSTNVNELKRISSHQYLLFSKHLGCEFTSHCMQWNSFQSTHFNLLSFSFSPGDLEKRAKIREPATLVILNATRSDTADYRCEVTAPSDFKSFDEILISLVVRGERFHSNNSTSIDHCLTALDTVPCAEMGFFFFFEEF